MHYFLSPPQPWRQPTKALNEPTAESPGTRTTLPKSGRLPNWPSFPTGDPHPQNDKMYPKGIRIGLPAAYCRTTSGFGNYESWATKKNAPNSSTRGKSESSTRLAPLDESRSWEFADEKLKALRAAPRPGTHPRRGRQRQSQI